MIITVYTTHCPKCVILEKALKNANLNFQTIEDVDRMAELGLKAVPYMEIEGNLMDFKTSMTWIKENVNNG